jgi:uncharacterized protein YcnI
MSAPRPSAPRRRLPAVLITTAVVVVAGATAASAHVVVTPSDTAAGTEVTKLTFRVPTESATAGTSKVRIDLPTATPFAEVLAEPVPGWKVSVTQGNLPEPVVVDGTTFTRAPVSVTWTAASRAADIPPNEFQEFSLSAGPIPDTGTLSFPATQTYSDGSVVKWNEPQPAGADEPEHPVPSFTVTAAQPDDDADAAATTTTAAKTATPLTSDSGHDATAIGLGVAGLVAGLLGLLLGALAWRRAGAR